VKRSREPEQPASAAAHESKESSNAGHQPVDDDADAEGGARKRLRQEVDVTGHTDQVSTDCLRVLGNHKLLLLGS
jgi:hypothetical protein